MKIILKPKRNYDIVNNDTVESLKENRRKYLGRMLIALNVICFLFACYQLWYASFASITAMLARAIHLGFGMSIVFLLYPMVKKTKAETKLPWYDLIFSILAIIPNLYIVLFYKDIAERAGIVKTADIIMGILMLVLLLEAARRVVGPILVGIASFFLLYTLFGNFFPGAFTHRGVSFAQMIRHMYLTTEGIFGTACGVACSFIVLFVLMGAILTYMGTGEFLIGLALCFFGKQRGGPAKAAVIASCLFGSINGSTIANIVTTGTFTIPLMKKVGYKPYFAGSIETTASTGGQIMPPIMGAAAFVIAEFMGVSYLKVCLAALVPAILYFTSILFAVHQEAVKMDIKGLSPEEIPDIRVVIKKWYLILPLFFIILMLALGFSPAMAGFTAVVSAIILSYISPDTRMTPQKLFNALADGAKNAIPVVIACALVGLIIGAFTISGLGLRLASLVIAFGAGQLLITLLLTAIASLILGMGVPTTANYVMMSMITVPAVVAMGVVPMAAHMFCFYFGIISDMTPPVALGALAGAGLAGAKFWPTAVNATKLGCAAYLVPFFFVYNPQLLLGVEPFSWDFIWMLATALIGIMLFSCGLFRFVITETTWWERILLLCAGFGCIDPGVLTDAIGLSIFALVYFTQKKRKKRLSLL